jgi:hypothetical protein
MNTQQLLTDRLIKATHYRDAAWDYLIQVQEGKAYALVDEHALSKYQRDYWDGYAKAINEALDLLEEVTA